MHPFQFLSDTVALEDIPYFPCITSPRITRRTKLGTDHKVKGGGVGWEIHIFGVCTFGSPPLNSCSKICSPPLNWC